VEEEEEEEKEEEKNTLWPPSHRVPPLHYTETAVD